MNESHYGLHVQAEAVLPFGFEPSRARDLSGYDPAGVSAASSV